MKKSEIKNATAAELITVLCWLNAKATVYKKDVKEHAWIVEELAERGIIEEVEAQSMHYNFEHDGFTSLR